jgi:glycerol-3-phosphate acyltransferase PlsY
MHIDFIAAFTAYLLGSVPFGLLLSKFFKNTDIRKYGSGNIGVTNAFRVAGNLVGGLTLLLDGTKGLIAIKIARSMGLENIAFYGMICVIGHIFPIWLKFKGGKGVATAIGVLIGIHLTLGIVMMLLWLLIFLITQIASLASLISTFIITLAIYFMSNDAINLICLAIILILILFRHKDNFIRLYNGKEKKFSK